MKNQKTRLSSMIGNTFGSSHYSSYEYHQFASSVKSPVNDQNTLPNFSKSVDASITHHLDIEACKADRLNSSNINANGYC